MKPSTLCIATSVITTLLLPACLDTEMDDSGANADVDVDVDVGSTTQELNGSWSFQNCSGYQSSLNAAMNFITARIGTSDFRECLKSAVMTEMHGYMVEDAITRLRSQPTTIQCKPPGGCGSVNGTNILACASVGPYTGYSEELITVTTEAITNYSTEDFAGIIVHEATHTQGWNHPGDPNDIRYPFSMPVQAASCIRNYVQEGLSRTSNTYDDTILARIGGVGGEPYDLRCPQNEVVTGMDVDSSNYINRIQVHCSGGTATTHVGAYNDSWRTENFTCPSGYSMSGFGGYATSIVRQLTGTCTRNTDLFTASTNPTTYSADLGGSATGTPLLRGCPVGMALKGIMGRSGGRIDQLQPYCEKYAGPHHGFPNKRGYLGSQVGSSKLDFCMGAGVGAGIYGHSGAEVDNIGMSCYPTSHDVNNDPVVAVGDDKLHVTQWTGGTGGAVFNERCEPGEALVGLRLRSGSRIDAAGTICVNPVNWLHESPKVLSESPLHGGGGGTLHELKCSSGEFLVGLRTWAKQNAYPSPTVQGIEIYCRQFND